MKLFCETGKIPYPTRAIAACARASKILKSRGDKARQESERLVPYVCPECRAWHLGHSYKRRRLLRKRLAIAS
jgi:hypothetical protein